jgi:hypothetical protein
MLAITIPTTFLSNFHDLEVSQGHNSWTTAHLTRTRTRPYHPARQFDTIAAAKASVPLLKQAARSQTRPLRLLRALLPMAPNATIALTDTTVSKIRQITVQIEAVLTALLLHSHVSSSSTVAPRHIQAHPPHPLRRLVDKIHLVVHRQNQAILRLASRGILSQMATCAMEIRKVRSYSAKNSTWLAATLVTPCLVRCPHLTTNLLQS